MRKHVPNDKRSDFFRRPSLNCLDQTDPELLQFIKEEVLWPPFLDEQLNISHLKAYRSGLPGREKR